MDADDDLDLMQATSVFAMVALLCFLDDALLQLGRFHSGQPDHWLDDFEETYRGIVEAILREDDVRRRDEAVLVVYAYDIIEALIGGVRNALADPTAPRTFPPHRIVINPEDVQVPPGHKPHQFSDFNPDSPFAVVRADTVRPDVSAGPLSEPDNRLPAPTAAPGLVMMTMGHSLVTTLCELGRHHGNTSGSWLDELAEKSLARIQTIRVTGFSESEKDSMINLARYYTFGARNTSRRNIDEAAQAA